jgi:4-hydroxyproline epimerase
MSRSVYACIEGHTEGMPVRMVVSGAPDLVGADMNQRRLYFVEHYDWLRRALTLEPKGHPNMSGTIFYPPISDNADFSLLFIETSGCLPMCGHATIGSVSFAIETGLVTPKTPGTVVVDVPAGQVTASYEFDGERVTSVRFTNVASFLLHKDLVITIPALGELTVDVAYGGNFYPIVEVQKNFPGSEFYSPAQLLEMGRQVRDQVNLALDVVHPDNPKIKVVKHCMWTGAPTGANSHARGVVIAGDQIIDRSPCGTGTSARVAQRFARGLLALGEPFQHESIIGSFFIGRAEAQTTLTSGLPAVFPSIEGRAWITGRSEHYIDPSDPYSTGFSLDDF